MAYKSSKYIFVTGGVVSGLGKGITAASLARLLINRGMHVTILKLDGYLNVNPAQISPLKHGEIYVTSDFKSTDLDLGHYERFLDIELKEKNSFSMGQIYNRVFQKESLNLYGNNDIQVIPHVTNEIKEIIRTAGLDNDLTIVEIGGTVGDIEQMSYMEAIRQLRSEMGHGNTLCIHVTLVPYLECSGEIKTKPTQASVRDLSKMGINTDILVCRTNKGIELDETTRKKLAMFCNLDDERHVIHCPDCQSIYQVPITIKEQNMDDIVLAKLDIPPTPCNIPISEWRDMVDKLLAKHPKSISVSINGKYTENKDAYLSIIESFKHAAAHCKVGIDFKFNTKKADIIVEGDMHPYALRENARPVQFLSRPYKPHEHFINLIKGVI